MSMMTNVNQMTSSTANLFTTFLNTKTGTILSVAAAMAIGGSFKDLVTSIVDNFLQPLIVKLILLTNITKLTKFDSLFSTKNNILNFSGIVSAIFSFLFIVFTVYIMVRIINNIGTNIIENEEEVKDKKKPNL